MDSHLFLMAQVARKPEKPSLASLRERIDEIDRKLLDLISMRAGIVEQVGQLKQDNGEVAYVPSRERAIYERMIAENPGPLTGDQLKRIFTEIISACRSLEHRPRIAYLGPEHTYSYEAALLRFGSSIDLVGESSFAGVFQALDNSRADFGVVPIENSTDGTVTLTLDLLIETSLVIVGEVLLPIRHFIGSRDGDPARVKKIVSHQQSLAQCRGYLARTFAGRELEAVASNAFAARRAAEDADCAAIASQAALEANGLRILGENIQDLANNTTRFLVMGHRPVERCGSDKTTVLFAVADKVGALHEAISCFARNAINISKIESRPLRSRAWEYIFFVDFGGHRDDAKVRRALKALERKALFLKVLGSYPEGRSAAA